MIHTATGNDQGITPVEVLGRPHEDDDHPSLCGHFLEHDLVLGERPLQGFDHTVNTLRTRP